MLKYTLFTLLGVVIGSSVFLYGPVNSYYSHVKKWNHSMDSVVKASEPDRQYIDAINIVGDRLGYKFALGYYMDGFYKNGQIKWDCGYYSEHNWGDFGKEMPLLPDSLSQSMKDAQKEQDEFVHYLVGLYGSVDMKYFKERQFIDSLNKVKP